MKKEELKEEIKRLQLEASHQRDRIGDLIGQVDYLTLHYEPYYPDDHKFTWKQKLGRYFATVTWRIHDSMG